MTCPGAENAVSFVDMKLPIAYLGGGVIVAVMFLAVFVGGANAGDCLRSQILKSINWLRKKSNKPPLKLI